MRRRQSRLPALAKALLWPLLDDEEYDDEDEEEYEEEEESYEEPEGSEEEW